MQLKPQVLNESKSKISDNNKNLLPSTRSTNHETNSTHFRGRLISIQLPSLIKSSKLITKYKNKV